MNFLAHTLLGFDDAELITGQIAGDFVRGSQLSHLPAQLETGIRLHRYLDRFTDSHPHLQAVRSSIDEIPLRFSGIVIDVLFDHFLARQWSHYSVYSLSQHADIVHAALAKNLDHLPEKMQCFAQVLVQERILENNIELSAIELTLARLSRRSPRFRTLAMDVSKLEPLRDQLHQTFESFYPDLLNAAKHYLDENGSSTTNNNIRKEK